jgi:hypothetical protein
MTTRRTFITRILPASALIGAPGLSAAQAARLAENDAVAQALGYRHDATKVDAKKHPTFAAGRICANCNLYAGKGSDPWAPCSAVGNKLVNAQGWCVAWVKKA